MLLVFHFFVVIPGNNLGNSQVSVYRTIGPTLVFVISFIFLFEFIRYLNIDSYLFMHYLFFSFFIFSSPEPLGSQGELIVYQSSRRPSVVRRRRRRKQFQTSSSPKPLGRSKQNFMWSLLG